MAKSIKDRLFERLPGTRTATEDTDFLREFKTEMKKVTWPSRKETMSSTRDSQTLISNFFQNRLQIDFLRVYQS